MTYPSNGVVETHCEGTQEWRITSPQFPGSMHCIESRFTNDPSKGFMLPSEAVRQYMANFAAKVAEAADWSSGP